MSANPLTYLIGTDHAGFPLKAPIIAFKNNGHTVIDFGYDSANPATTLISSAPLPKQLHLAKLTAGSCSVALESRRSRW